MMSIWIFLMTTLCLAGTMGSAVAESGHASLAPSIGAKFCLLPDGNTCFTPRASQPGVFFCVKIPPGAKLGGLLGAGRPGGYTASAVGTAGAPAPDQEMEPFCSIQCAAPRSGGSPVRLR